jgi:hypothetical protein
MSRKSLLLIAAAVISTPAFVTSNALAKGSAAAYGFTSTPHVSTLGVARRVAVPQAKLYGTPGLGSRKNASSIGGPYGQALEKAKQIGEAAGKNATGNTSTSNGGPFGQALDKAKQVGEAAGKNATGNTSTSSGGPFGQAVDKAKKIGEDAAKAAQAAAEKAAREAADAKAKLQTPADGKLGSQITPTPTPTPQPTPKGTPDGGYRPHFPGGVLVFGSGVSLDPVVVEPGPVVANSTVTARIATSRVAGAVTDGATTPRPNPCNCLVKERLQDGSVLFMDICTKESARSVPTNDTATPRDAQ